MIGIVTLSELSSSLEISSLMSRLMNVLLTMWIWAVDIRARAASTMAGTGASFCSTTGRSPGMLPTTWTVDASGEITPPASAGESEYGSTTLSNVGCSTPSTEALAAVRSATSRWTSCWNVGSRAAFGPPSRTMTRRSAGATGSPAPRTSYATSDSRRGPFGSCSTSIVRIPPNARPAPSVPNVPTNQSRNTGHRCRALQVAIRTVSGACVTRRSLAAGCRLAALHGTSVTRSLRGRHGRPRVRAVATVRVSP